jgi:hypothetical protein
MRGSDAAAFAATYQPVLCALVAADGAVSVERLSALACLDEFHVRNVLDVWRPFLFE